MRHLIGKGAEQKSLATYLTTDRVLNTARNPEGWRLLDEWRNIEADH